MTVVCVLGMSRSGTSLTARVLNLAGVHLGAPEELLTSELPALPDDDRERALAANPKGFWEHYGLIRLNERILRKLGGSWREPPELAPGWEQAAELEPEREEARALIEGSFTGRELWGWKDPRNCLTLPFWQRLLPEMRYVICLRNPVDVAASLARRDGMPFEQAVDLWQTYVAAALTHTAGRVRLLVRYESFFEDFERAPARLACFVGRAGAFAAADARARLADVVDSRLWRNRDCGDLAERGDVPPATVALHLLAEALAESGEADRHREAVS